VADNDERLAEPVNDIPHRGRKPVIGERAGHVDAVATAVQVDLHGLDVAGETLDDTVPCVSVVEKAVNEDHDVVTVPLWLQFAVGAGHEGGSCSSRRRDGDAAPRTVDERTINCLPLSDKECFREVPLIRRRTPTWSVIPADEYAARTCLRTDSARWHAEPGGATPATG
jgi:hypothetical protein